MLSKSFKYTSLLTTLCCFSPDIQDFACEWCNLRSSHKDFSRRAGIDKETDYKWVDHRAESTCNRQRDGAQLDMGPGVLLSLTIQ